MDRQAADRRKSRVLKARWQGVECYCFEVDMAWEAAKQLSTADLELLVAAKEKAEADAAAAAGDEGRVLACGFALFL